MNNHIVCSTLDQLKLYVMNIYEMDFKTQRHNGTETDREHKPIQYPESYPRDSKDSAS